MKKNSNDDINEIRKIMFGDTIKSYSKKINSLEKSLQKQIDSLHESIETSQADITDQLYSEIKSKAQISQDFAQNKVQSLEEHHHELIYRKYKHMRTSLNKLKEDLVEVQKKQNSKLDKLKAQFKNDLQKEISNKIDEIKSNYITKESLSELLIQLSNSISKN